MNKLTKLLSVFIIAGAVGTGIVGTAGCKTGGNNNGGNGNEHTTHTYTYEEKNDTHHVKKTTCTEHEVISEDEAHVYDDENDATCNLCTYTRELGGDKEETGNAIVPEYKGEAAGPEAGVHELNSKFLATEIPQGTLEEEYSDGFITLPKSTVIRNKSDNGGKYSKHSVNNGKFTISVPAAGKLSIYFASGSSTASNAKYSLTKPDGSKVEANVTGKAQWDLVELTIEDAEPGEYKFETASGTIEVWEISLESSITATPIKEIELVSTGTTDYLVTQKVDCTGISLIAKDENGVPYSVNLENCTFDTSKYNPKTSGEYEIGVTYHLSDNLDSEAKEFTATYKVRVYMVDAIELNTIGLSGSTQVAVQQAYLPNGTFSKNYLSIIGTCGFGDSNIQQKLKDEWVSVSTPTLTAEGTQTVTVTVDSTYTTGNKEVKATYDVVVKAKKEVVDNKVEVTVGATGEFATLTQAVQYLKACNYESGVNKVIKLDAGTYTEKVWLDIDNVTLLGTGTEIEDTVLSYSLVEGDVDYYSSGVWGLSCATLHVTGKNFKAYNLSIRNDFDYIANSKKYTGTQGPQGVALTLDADGAVIYNCHIYGNQDTLYMKSGRSYYYKTQIDGNIDFIFGGEDALAFFEECEIKAINKTAVAEGQKGSEQNGYVTAAKHSTAKKPDYGYIFYKCNLTDDGKVKDGAMSLGRSWGEIATVAYIECTFSAAYSKVASDGSGKDHRWYDWSNGTAAKDADFVEYGSTGDGAIVTAVTGGRVLTAEQAANYTKSNIFSTSNGKIGYTTAFDCDTAYANLRILAGLDDGTIAEDPTKTYDLLGFTGGQLQGANGTAEYLGIKIDATKGKFNVRTNGDVQINPGTILKVPMSSRYKVSVTDNKNADVLPGDDFTVEYVIEEGQLYAKITFTKSGSFYAKSIIVDGTTEMPATEYYSVTFDANYTEAEASEPIMVIGGYKVAKPANPSREGWTFEYWYAGDDDTVEYDFGTPVTENLVLKAKWTAGETVLEPTLISEAKEFNFGKGTTTAITKAVEGGEDKIDELLVNGTFKSNGGGWYSIAKDTTITLKVAAGFKVVFEVYKNGSYTVTVNGEDKTSTLTSEMVTSDREAKTLAAQEGESTIVLTCTGNSCYVGIITVGEIGE